MKRIAWSLGLVVVLVGLLGAGSVAARDLRIGITQYPSTLHPNIDTMAAKSYVHGLSQRPFTLFGPDWELMCMLCTELPSFDNGRAVRVTNPEGGPGVALTYTIVEGAVWGDGTPITTRDVQFTWEVGRHPQSGVSNAELYRRLYKLEIHDERSFTLYDEKLDYNYGAINDFRLVPEHLERPVFEADPATYRNRTRYDTEPTNPGLHFGPYRLASLDPGSTLVYERNPRWWGKAPAFERIIVRTIENTAALEANLLSGEIDMIEGSLGLALDQAQAFERRHGSRFQVFYKPGLVYEHIDLRLDNPILADVRVRRALLHGIDREALNERLFGGRQPVAHSNVNPLDWTHTDEVPTYPYDPERAAALLEEAGWTRGPRGTRVNAAGEPMRLEFMTTAGNRTRELVQQVLQSQWAQLGIEVTIRNEPPRVLFAESLSKRRFTGMVLFAWISSPEHLPRSTLHSEEIPTEERGWAGQNYTGFAHPRVDELIDAITVELDRDAREPLWHELQRIYAEELPALPLYFRSDAHIWPSWLQGVVPTGHMYPVTLWVEDWQIAGS